MANEVQQLVTSNPNARGLVVIVTDDYKDSSDKQLRKKPLPACHLDGDKMRKTFREPEMNFALLPTKKNRPASEIKSLIKQVAKCKFPSSYKYFIFVYSGHGGDNCVVPNDGVKVNIQCSIINPLEPGKTSPATGKIVKLFFFTSLSVSVLYSDLSVTITTNLMYIFRMTPNSRCCTSLSKKQTTS